MRIDFDPAKDRSNARKHGVSLGIAAELEWEEALVWIDDRFAYDEPRMVALVPRGDRLFYVAFVDRGDHRRVISLRYAERREIKHYVESHS